jgi:hypothetical protein
MLIAIVKHTIIVICIFMSVGAKKAQGGSVGDILSRPSGQRSHEQNFAVISFIMSSWETANLLGYKRTSLLFKDVKQVSHDKGDQIVVAGEASMFLYIVVTGGDDDVYLIQFTTRLWDTKPTLYVFNVNTQTQAINYDLKHIKDMEI